MYKDILQQNALYYKRYIKPYLYILIGKKGSIIVRSNEENFAHLVGKQYSENVIISHMPTTIFYKKALNGEITIQDMLNCKLHNDSDINCLSIKKNNILNKNTYFIDSFESFINKTKIRMYVRDERNTYNALDIDFHHNDESHSDYINVLGLKGHLWNDFFSFATIIHATLENDKKRFMKKKPLNFYVKKIMEKDLNQFIKQSNGIIESPRNTTDNHLGKVIKINKKTKINLKKLVPDINNFLVQGLSVKFGVNGNNTLEIRKNGKVVASKYRPLKTLTSAIEVARDIDDKYG